MVTFGLAWPISAKDYQDPAFLIQPLFNAQEHGRFLKPQASADAENCGLTSRKKYGTFQKEHLVNILSVLERTMTNEPPIIMAHVSVGTNDFPKAKEFYKAVLATIGAKVIMEVDVPGEVGAIAFGKIHPEFWVQTPHDKQQASVGNGAHFAFLATTKDAVHAFWDKALEMGATPDGEPGPRPHYGEAYYGCFVRDLDGNKIEAMFWGAHDQFEG